MVETKRKRRSKRKPRQKVVNEQAILILVIELECACRERVVPPEKVGGYFRQLYRKLADHSTGATISALVRSIVEILKQYL